MRDRNGNMRPRPVTIESAHKKGEPTLVQLFKTKVRKNAEICELDNDGSVIKRIRLKACSLRGFHIDGHDAQEDSVVIQRLNLHPKSVDVLEPKSGQTSSPGKPAAQVGL